MMIKNYSEHIAYMDDEYDHNEILELVGIPSGLFFEFKKKDHTKIQSMVDWSDKYNCYVYRDRDHDIVMQKLGIGSGNNKFIKDKLKEMKIYSYDIINDKVRVYGDVDIKYATYARLPFKFLEVTGNFNLTNSAIETLENCPDRVGRNFNVSFNRLMNLKGGPSKVGHEYNCSHNYINSLLGSAKEVMFYNCSYNNLENLQFGPTYVAVDFNCSHNKLIDIKDAPHFVSRIFDCSSNNKLFGMKGLPKNASKIISDQ